MSQNQEYYNITTILDNPPQPITKQQIPTVDTIKKIAKALNVSIEDLIK